MTQDQKNTDHDTAETSAEEQKEQQISENHEAESEQNVQQNTPADDKKSTDTEQFHEKNKSSNNEVPQQNSPGIKKAAVAIIVFLLLGLIAFGLWKSYQPSEIELQGRVEAETLHVSTKVPSRIENIYIHEGQKVSKNQQLVRFSSPEVEAKKQQALASLQSALALQATAERGSQQENIASLYANWQSLKAQKELAQVTLKRGENLFREGVISKQKRDEMKAAAQSATQMSEAAYQQYARAERGSTPEQKTTANAQVDIARAAVAEVSALEAETDLLSPVNGTVSKTYGKVSELVAAGVPVVSIILDDELWVSLNVREDQYAQVYKAETIQGYIPALDRTVTFKIKNIDAEGEFSTIKTTRQTGGYDIRSFRLRLVPEQHITDLKAGMSVLFKIKEVR